MNTFNTIAENVKKKAVDHYGQRIVALALFGSAARNAATPDSDLDVFIVLKGLPARILDRVPEQVAAAKAISSGRPVDVLLVTPEEASANFDNHNPLYLDIAIDGVVLVDTDGFLEGLIRKTRRYIEEKGVRRQGDTWFFPVRERVATALSQMTNRDWAKVWLVDASRDFAAAVKLKEADLFEKSVYHSQQTVEKAIKAVLVCWGAYKKSHLVADALETNMQAHDLGEWKTRLGDLVRIGKDLEPHVSLSRYPGMLSSQTLWAPHLEYDNLKSAQALSDAQKALDIASQFIDWWFE